MKNWKYFGDECARCGSEAEVLTSATPDGHAYDGDDARCIKCGLTGSISVGDEDENGDCSAYVGWDDYEEED